MKFPNSILPILICFLIFAYGCDSINHKAYDSTKKIKSEEEVFYLIFPRSFYDSNGDQIGDLNGVTEKLDYLQELGVTSIIMTPLYPSIYYHNYFTHDFEGIDEEFGSKEDYLNMVREIHRRSMKFYMDTEVQYVTEEHPWFKDSYKNPSSEYSNYIFYKDSLNNEPVPIIFDLTGLKSYDGRYLDIARVNLYNKRVRKYIYDLFNYWVDPNEDGKFDDGVDGFRLDHTMDNLDNKNLLTNMLEDFWKPLIINSKKINPDLKFIAEQSEWDKPGWVDPAYDFFEKAGIDLAYSFGHMFNISDKEKFESTINTELIKTPAGKYFFLFLDQHDTDRFGSKPGWNTDLNKQKAAMIYLSNGIPLIYYGQEIGMKGKRLNESLLEPSDTLNDGYDVPRREALEWKKNINRRGMATWFRDVQPYWDNRSIVSDDGISVEEQNSDNNSLLNFYRKILNFRKSNSAFTTGSIKVISNSNKSILTYCRFDKDSKFLLAFNFARETVTTNILSENLPFEFINDSIDMVFSDSGGSVKYSENTLTVKLKENGFAIIKLE
ncbi:MAG: alpha-amylase family glycosyl hydrolase [Ignavibacteriaceae bacterium]